MSMCNRRKVYRKTKERNLNNVCGVFLILTLFLFYESTILLSISESAVCRQASVIILVIFASRKALSPKHAPSRTSQRSTSLCEVMHRSASTQYVITQCDKWFCFFFCACCD